MAEIEGKVGSLVKAVEGHAALIAFLYQTTAKETSGSVFPTLSAQGKVQAFVDSVGGRTLGIYPFNKTFQLQNGTNTTISNWAPRTFNIANANNPVTQIGVFLWLTHQAGFSSARVGRLGAHIAIGGAIGGVFDDPIVSSSQNLTGFQGAAYPVGNYSATANNGISGTSLVPWTQA